MNVTRSSVLIFAFLLSGTIGSTAQGQSPETEAVRDVVEGLFDAMRSGDGDALAALFHPEATLRTVALTDDGAVVRQSPIPGFVAAVGADRDDVWDEHIDNVIIQVDGPLATAWMDYAFYIGERFSHCGVNALEFVKMADGWRILSVTDTRRTDGCDPWEGATR